MGTQKNRLIETVLLSTQNICLKLWVRKYLQLYAENFSLSKPVIVCAEPVLSRGKSILLKDKNSASGEA